MAWYVDPKSIIRDIGPRKTPGLIQDYLPTRIGSAEGVNCPR